MSAINFWAKRLDKANHIVDSDSKQVGGGVLCGKYGALLGNNYADGSFPVCPDCLSEFQKRAEIRLQKHLGRKA